MKYICKEDLKSEIKTCGDVELEAKAEHLTNKIIDELGNGDGLVSAQKAKDRIHNLKYGNKLYEDHMPKTIFDSPYFTPDEIVQYIDSQLIYIKDKYAPHGLELPFNSLEDAHNWI